MVLKKAVVLGLLAVFLLVLPSNAYSAVLINEIMYNPSPSQGSDTFNEWIEIFNDGKSSVDLTNATLCGEPLLKGYTNHSDASINRNTTFILEPAKFALVTDGGSGTEVYGSLTVDSNALAFHVSSSSMCSDGLINSGEEINLTAGNESHIINYTPFVTLFPSTSDSGKTLIFYKGNFTESG